MMRRLLLLVGLIAALLGATTTSANAGSPNSGIWFDGWAGGSGINMLLAPPDLQACFGTDTWFGFGVTPRLQHVNRTNDGFGHFDIVWSVGAGVTNDAGETFLSGSTIFTYSDVVPLDADGNAVVVMPATLMLDGSLGLTRVTLNFHSDIHVGPDGVGMGSYASVPDYSDISCERVAP